MKYSFARRLLPLALAAALWLTPAGTLRAHALTQAQVDAALAALAVPSTLSINRPAQDISTTAANYYLCGYSDPAQPLYCNGQPVGGRGRYGSFGVYAPLGLGANRFSFTQGGVERSVTITRTSPSTAVALTDKITQPYPASDTVQFSGDTVTLSCVAPAGAQVTATVSGSSFTLAQSAATQYAGVPATYRAACEMPAVSGVYDMGAVRYTLHYNGKTSTVDSQGRVYLVGAGNRMGARIVDVSALVSTGEKYLTTAKLGAVDAIVETSGDRYKLSMGGWVNKYNVELLGDVPIDNEISTVSFTTGEDGEYFVFSGTRNAIVTSELRSDHLYVKLHNTTGLRPFTMPEISRLFSRAELSQADDGVALRLYYKAGAPLWGHLIEYDEGAITLYCKYTPLSWGDPAQPLKGRLIALDAGHGKTDVGAVGIAGTKLAGPAENAINYAAALCLAQRLSSLGATVLLTGGTERTDVFTDRMLPAQQHRADLFISLHANSSGENANGLTAKGVEVYYYEPIAKGFAESLLANISAATSRPARWANYAVYRVTFNTCSPSVLVEMGFTVNPIEYDDMCSPEGIEQLVGAVTKSVVELLG